MAKKHRDSAPEAPAAVVAESLTKTYGDLVALAPLDLSIPTGQLVALVGHNGSGKSTLLKLVCGLLDPSDGDVAVHGHPAGSIGARAAATYIGDAPVLYDDLSVREHLEYLSRLHGVADWEPRSEELLERLGLLTRADDLPSQFSRGLRQKTALAIGFVRDASVLLIDEPFVGLDASGRQTLLALLGERRAKGTTIALATHDLAVLDRADRCVALQNGEVIHDGPIDPTAALGLVG